MERFHGATHLKAAANKDYKIATHIRIYARNAYSKPWLFFLNGKPDIVAGFYEIIETIHFAIWKSGQHHSMSVILNIITEF